MDRHQFFVFAQIPEFTDTELDISSTVFCIVNCTFYALVQFSVIYSNIIHCSGYSPEFLYMLRHYIYAAAQVLIPCSDSIAYVHAIFESIAELLRISSVFCSSIADRRNNSCIHTFTPY